MFGSGILLAEWFNGPQRQLYGLYPLTRAVVGSLSLDLFRVIALTLTQIVDWHASSASKKGPKRVVPWPKDQEQVCQRQSPENEVKAESVSRLEWLGFPQEKGCDCTQQR